MGGGRWYGRMGGLRVRVRDGQRGGCGFVESLRLLRQRLNARGGEGEGKRAASDSGAASVVNHASALREYDAAIKALSAQ